ncbi:hypothetical protein P691DRAFT_777553 [Macrolepiota fuliginosa MF-IS2]|uniref:IMD domain-containing protein n=1 Tax=Macrolepiota fuliginosa MF-IS2 TaxID=1400762 RepID=A0A9P6C1L2_9AGAR|nr:hypothetical protein P691DRAFT_777553 [Macrolepiota fuliginosa MF-IS2]
MNNIFSSTSSNNSQNQQAVAERSDIHRSCKSLETLLNILNDYCEAATAIVALHKKLAKALRDAAGLKVTNEIAGNAFNASANIFEALADVDAKFVKITDKEYDAISTEVKKWFKRLAKEEKVHDERIATANAKIKQAGLTYEKKSKKRAGDSQEEHSRYIQLISMLGPEITQEKYNHSLQATQRHTTTIYSVAACLCRIADTEWGRTCESVRRFAPTIGPLGEWRSLCEGGWVKDVPGDLVDPEEKVEDKLKLNTIQERTELEEEEGSKDGQRQYRSHQFQRHREQDQQQQQTYEHTPPLPTYQHVSGEPTTPSTHYQDQHQLHNLSRSDREPTTFTSASCPSQAQSSPSSDSPILQRHPPSSAYSSTPSLSPPAPGAPPTALSAGTTGMSMPTPAAIPAITSGRTSSDAHLRAPPPSQQRPPYSRDDSPASDDRERLFSDPVTGSVRSLSAFPAPPTHFPLPPPRPRDLPITVRNQAPPQGQPVIWEGKEGWEEQTYAARERLSESPLPMDEPRSSNEASEGLGPPSNASPRTAGGAQDTRPRRRHSNSTLDGFHPRQHESNQHIPSLQDPNSPNANSAPVPTTPTRLPVIRDERDLRASDRNDIRPMETQEELHLREFGVLREERLSGGVPDVKARSFPGGSHAEGSVEFPSASAPPTRRGGLVERADTGNSASGSIVAAMKDRYSNASGSRSPPLPADLPRLHTSVSDLANRYQPPLPSTAPLPPTHPMPYTTEGGERMKQSPLRPLSKSPPPPLLSRRISLPPTPEKIEPRQHVSSLTPTSSPRPLPSTSTGSDAGSPANQKLRERQRNSLEGTEDKAHWRRIEELAELGFRAKERELREREQEINMRERELDRDRARLLALREGCPGSSSASASVSANSSEQGGHDLATPQASQLQPRPRERRISLLRSRQDSQPTTPQMKTEQLLPPPSRLVSQGHLIPSSSSPNLRERHQSHHSYSSPPPSSPSNNNARDPEFSSPPTPASASGASPSSYLSRSTGSPPVSYDKSPQQPQQEKKGGWMRRLSMPVGNALPFSLDSSKRHANNSNSSTTSTAATPSSANAGVRPLGAGIVGGKGVQGVGPDEPSRRFAQYRDRDRDGYQQQQDAQDGGRFGGLGLGLGRRSYDGSRSATNLNLGLGTRK